MAKRLLISASLFMSTISVVNATGFEILAPHRAIYDVKLKSAEDRSGIRSMDGRIVYEVKGNECEGIAVKYRFVTNIRTGTELFVTDQRSATYESADGKQFTFKTNNYVNDQQDESVQGNARQDEKSTSVILKKPTEKEFSLDPASFVSSHLVKVIEKARSGDVILQTDIFDGSGAADEVVASTAIIGKKKSQTTDMKGEKADTAKALFDVNAWPITISYFKKDIGNTAESLPIYEASFLLHENGITRELTMRYPDYALTANLKQLEMLEKTSCD